MINNRNVEKGIRPCGLQAVALTIGLAVLLLNLPGRAAVESGTAVLEDRGRLGEAFFFDKNLSLHRTQSCATCHDPAHAFTDARDNGVAGAVSLGDDGKSLGGRNTPTISYAALIPKFRKKADSQYQGGLFYDGRAVDLVEQALGPLLNPVEMALPGRHVLVRRVRENPRYVSTMRRMFGDAVFMDSDRVSGAVAVSIAAFERSARFSPFDSRYDRYLRGEYQMTTQQELGRQLFFSDFVNCGSCHLSERRPAYVRETFTDYSYRNIGVPANPAIHRQQGASAGHRDHGLLNNPAVNDPVHEGKFRVPTLRNAAVTGPYMHNGVFRELRTVLLFYSSYTVIRPDNRLNPETGQPWREAEVKESLELELLQKGQPLGDTQIDALLAFLETLTDRRYEHLLDGQPPDPAGG